MCQTERELRSQGIQASWVGFLTSGSSISMSMAMASSAVRPRSPPSSQQKGSKRLVHSRSVSASRPPAAASAVSNQGAESHDVLDLQRGSKKPFRAGARAVVRVASRCWGAETAAVERTTRAKPGRAQRVKATRTHHAVPEAERQQGQGQGRQGAGAPRSQVVFACARQAEGQEGEKEEAGRDRGGGAD